MLFWNKSVVSTYLKQILLDDSLKDTICAEIIYIMGVLKILEQYNMLDKCTSDENNLISPILM